jgi:hypothetical protein
MAEILPAFSWQPRAPFLPDLRERVHARETARESNAISTAEWLPPQCSTCIQPREVAMNRSTLFLIGACLTCFLAPAAAEAGLLRHGKADLCIGVDHASKTKGADIKLFRCDGRINQQWDAQPVERGFYNYVNKNSGMCMGVNHASKKPGADLKQFPCDGSLNQKWTRNLVNKKSELCVGADRVAHDTQLEQVRCGNVHVFSAGD